MLVAGSCGTARARQRGLATSQGGREPRVLSVLEGPEVPPVPNEVGNKLRDHDVGGLLLPGIP